MANTILQNIYMYPIKGFPGIGLAAAQLTKAEGIPGDRRYAITRGTRPTGDWMPARSYYINAHVDGLMKFTVEAPAPGQIRISNPSGRTLVLDGDNPESLQIANRDLAEFMAHVGVTPDLPPPQVIERGNRGNWDYPDTVISIINKPTVAAISAAIGIEMDPLRYRGNLVIDGLPAWEEFALMGRRVRLGKAELEVMRPIVRCPTPGVDPATGDRNIDFEKLLPEHFGHAYCGMYAVVTKPGEISTSDALEIIGDAEMPLATASSEAEDYRLWPRIVEITTCESGSDATRMSLAGTGPWPLPEARPGQRLRFLTGADNWTTEYIAKTTPGRYHLEIEKSATSDPATEHLRTAHSTGDRIAVCGPFGRASE